MRNLLSFKLFSSHCFQVFFRVFRFQKFNYDVSCHEVLWVYFVGCLLSFLNVQIPESTDLTSLAKFGKFSAIHFFKYFFLKPIFFFFSFQGLDDILDFFVPKGDLLITGHGESPNSSPDLPWHHFCREGEGRLITARRDCKSGLPFGLHLVVGWASICYWLLRMKAPAFYLAFLLTPPQ